MSTSPVYANAYLDHWKQQIRSHGLAKAASELEWPETHAQLWQDIQQAEASLEKTGLSTVDQSLRRTDTSGFSGQQARLFTYPLDQSPAKRSVGEPVSTPSFPSSIPTRLHNLAAHVICHSSNDKWTILLRALTRVAAGERQWLQDPLDDDRRKLETMARNVHRSAHKMKAFMRFQPIDRASCLDDLPAHVAASVRTGAMDDEEQEPLWLAWFESTHPVAPLISRFLVERFKNMDWLILTQYEQLSWIDGQLRHGPPLRKPGCLGDDFDVYWKTYYASTFNPARLNMRMMQSEMPVRYWKNLPEAQLISQLQQTAGGRTGRMLAQTTELPGTLAARSRMVRETQLALRGASTSTGSRPASTDLGETDRPERT